MIDLKAEMKAQRKLADTAVKRSDRRKAAERADYLKTLLARS